MTLISMPMSAMHKMELKSDGMAMQATSVCWDMRLLG